MTRSTVEDECIEWAACVDSQEALARAQDIGATRFVVRSHLALAELAQSAGDPDAAVASSRAALEAAIAGGYEPGAKEARAVLDKIATAMAAPTTLLFEGEAERVEPDLVSTPNSEIRITFGSDGRRMLWGTIGWEGGAGGWDIWESRREGAGWTKPLPAPFNSSANDFDPFFAQDGSGVYFFSNRAGGLGGDDLWFAPYVPTTGKYGDPKNLGPNVNTSKDEWAPTLSKDGAMLVFSSCGWGGKGGQDLCVAKLDKDGWRVARPIDGALNSSIDDFDACFLHDGTTLVLTRKALDGDEADLFVSFQRDGGYSEPVKLGPMINSEGSWNLGPAINVKEPGVLYFTSHRPGQSKGRADIYRIRYRVR